MELDWLLAPPLPEAMPRQRLLYHRLRDAILCGRLAPATRLPASRAPAAKSRRTVIVTRRTPSRTACRGIYRRK